MDFDLLLTQHVGEFGRGQLLVLLAASSGWVTLAMAVLSMVFVTQTPTWSCTAADDALCQRQLQLQSQDPTALCVLSKGQYSWDNPRFSLIATFELVCNDSWKVSWANAVFFVGYAAGSALFGWVADTHGRKAAQIASALSAACATLLCAASSSYGQYIAARVLQGLCCSGLPIASYVLSTESVGPACRGRAGTGSQVVYHLGEWMLPLLAFAFQDWRLLYAAVAACCVLTAALAALVPESPRWQLLHGQQAQAVRTLRWLARMNGRQLPDAVAAQLLAAQPCGRGSGTVTQEQPQAAAQTKVAAAMEHFVLDEDEHVGDQQQQQQHWQQQDWQQQQQQKQDWQQQHRQKQDGQQDGQQSGDTELLLGAARCSGAKQPLPLQYHQGEEQQQQQEGLSDKQQHAGHASDTVWMIFTDPLLARLFWVSSWLCTVMAAAFFTANLATEKLQGSLYVNFILTSLGELPATLIGAVAVDALGRRPTIATGVLLTGCACFACSLLSPGVVSTTLASLGKAACSSAWSLAYIYAAELMPTSVRSAALAGSNQAARLGGAVAPFFIYAGERLGHPKMPFALVGVLSAVTAAMTLLLPETLGRPQPDTMADLRRMYGGSSSSGSSSRSSNRGSGSCSSSNRGGVSSAPEYGLCNADEASTDLCNAPHAQQLWKQSKLMPAASLGAALPPGDSRAAGQPQGLLQEESLVESQGSGVLQRLLSRASSSGSWLLAAGRSFGGGSDGGQQHQWSRVLQSEDWSELVPVGSARTDTQPGSAVV